LGFSFYAFSGIYVTKLEDEPKTTTLVILDEGRRFAA